jgi:hypothetical protein
MTYSIKDLAIKHWEALVLGGLDGREYTNSMLYIRDALNFVPDDLVSEVVDGEHSRVLTCPPSTGDGMPSDSEKTTNKS